MGWATELQDASFRGVQFECTSTNDAVSKSLAVKQAPYSNEAEIEDVGNNPRNISINAVYAGDDYKTWVDALEAALLETGAGELIHPIYGIMQVNVVDYSVDHNAENVDSCTISIKFIQAKDKKRELFVPVAVLDEIYTEDIIDEPASALEQYLKKLKVLDQNQFFDAVNNVSNGINTFRDGLNLAKTAIENVLAPADFIVGLVDDVSGLVTFDANISALSKWRDLVYRVQRFEKLFQNDKSSPQLQQLWRATQVASTVAITQKVIENVRTELAENKESSLTPIDLAVIRQNNRQQIQAAINTEREQIATELNETAVSQIQVYKETADQLHLQIQELIEIRPPVTKTVITVPCTLHWLAHQLYEDMSRASEILRLNPDLVNPAVLRPGMELTVYAR
ncbi:DNA circularization protein [Acinetobacter pragensis]|uniref:Multidrug DMT transporter n=1 Tax=Acinetobacter pragensis TaxID=1806892 RepID=A0A151Y1X5_9GAMM|nr:DNA circularization N-terminal domain-containing protein [Acinetobacter pragensis]KYQ72046.1 multidrug DMT transporter [Acinetobacter pragensis]